MDPFPAFPQLQAAGAVVDRARQGVAPLEHLARLARRAPSMTPSLRRRALQALRGALQREQQALFVPSEGLAVSPPVCSGVGGFGQAAGAGCSHGGMLRTCRSCQGLIHVLPTVSKRWLQCIESGGCLAAVLGLHGQPFHAAVLMANYSI